MIICYTIPEIWHMTDIIIFQFGPFFALLPSKNQNSLKMKKNTWRHHHFTQVCQKSWSYDHMLYCSWYMVCDRCNRCFSVWAIICPFTPIKTKKLKIKKKNEKKSWRKYHHFTYVYQKLWSDNVRFLRYGARQTDGQTDRNSNYT